ncbi:MAG: MopE-related protein [bacterium]
MSEGSSFEASARLGVRLLTAGICLCLCCCGETKGGGEPRYEPQRLAQGLAGFRRLPMENGWHEQRFNVISMVEFDGRLYAGTQRKRDLEADPPVDGGLEVLCICPEGDLWKWQQVAPTGFETGNGLGFHNFSVTGMQVFGGRLYVGTWNDGTGAELWRTRAGILRPETLEDWERVDPGSFSGHAVTSMAAFHDHLYAGIFTQPVPIFSPGCAVWRSADGERWARVSFDGFLDPFNSDATTLVVHDDGLYVGTENGYFYSNLRAGTGTEIWRTGGADLPWALFDWRQVNRDGFGVNGGNVFNQNTTMMISHNGVLYAGTDNAYTGAELWRYDGIAWERVVFDSSRTRNTLSVTYHSGVLFGGDLYLGTVNPFTGGEVWKWNGSVWSRVNEPGFGDGHGVAGAPVVYGDRLIVVGNGGPEGATLYALSGSYPLDQDRDGVADDGDDCPTLANPAQADRDGNGVGDDCQDDDADGVPVRYDCNDRDSAVHPGAGDPCSDGADRDCDGRDAGGWEWDDDGIDSNCNSSDNCGTVPVAGPGRGTTAVLFPWVLAAVFIGCLKALARRSSRIG